MRNRVVAPALFALVVVRGLMACTDGVTPDCSDPAVCSPIEGDAGPLVQDSSTSEGSANTDASTADVARVEASSPVDAADGG